MELDTAVMPRTRNDDSGQYVETYPNAVFIEAIEANDGAASTTEITEDVGCSYETAYKRLRTLEDDGSVTRRKVGNANLWMAAAGDEHQ